MIKIIKILLSCFLLPVDWWKLFSRAKVKGNNSIWDYACRIKLRMQGSYIGHDAKFSSKPFFPHGIAGIFISGGGIIGSNCIIFQQVTIGSNSLQHSKGEGAPIIGNNCYIGAGAKIIGGITVGNNCRIGSNAVVTENIPDNCTVVLSKARIIEHEYDLDNKFFCNKSGKKVFWNNGVWAEENSNEHMI